MNNLIQDVFGRSVDEDILVEMIDYVYGSLASIILSVVIYGTLCWICYGITGDPFFRNMVLAGISVCALRTFVSLAYRGRRTRGRLDRSDAEKWQALYLAAGVLYALWVGLFAAAATQSGDDAVLAFGLAAALTYATGILIYVSVRPAIAFAIVCSTMIPGVIGTIQSGSQWTPYLITIYVLGMLYVAKSITQQHSAFVQLYRTQKALDALSQTDPLTGLSNRRTLDTAIEATPIGETAAVVLLDLDGFKPINDRLGHEAGDEVLRRVAAAIRTELQPTDIVARTGGDEFVILLRNVTAGYAAMVGEQVRKAVSGSYVIDGETVRLGVSVGIAESASDRANLVQHADEAMYAAKRTGRGRVCVRPSRTDLLQTSHSASVAIAP